MDINELLAEIPASTTKGGSKYDRMLPADTVKTLDVFTAWLVDEDSKTVATSRSYRSYVSKTLALDMQWDEMTSDQRSGARCFAKFLKLHPELIPARDANEDEISDDTDDDTEYDEYEDIDES